MGESSIEWTDATWNPVTGCDRVSPGCKNCYALDLAARLKRMGQPRYQKDGTPPTSGPGFGVTLHPDKLDEPLRWRKPRRVFVNSMSDLFHPEIPDEYIAQVFSVMRRAEQHTFQVLTKRPERMRDFVRRLAWESASRPYLYPEGEDAHAELFGAPYICPNIWLGTSIEMQTYNGRADALRATPAAVRFISAEPLLGSLINLDLDGIDWLIVGGESGPRHRPMNPHWVRELREMASISGTAFFFKQWGGRTPKSGGRELDGLTWDEYPQTEPVHA